MVRERLREMRKDRQQRKKRQQEERRKTRAKKRHRDIKRRKIQMGEGEKGENEVGGGATWRGESGRILISTLTAG